MTEVVTVVALLVAVISVVANLYERRLWAQERHEMLAAILARHPGEFRALTQPSPHRSNREPTPAVGDADWVNVGL